MEAHEEILNGVHRTEIHEAGETCYWLTIGDADLQQLANGKVPAAFRTYCRELIEFREMTDD